ncbi:MAG: hypothetical protein IR164_13515 [Devosia sp.]|jgi:hypothetical protein|uniref:hypothetical protein n=1 Tax=unclassified Devosia TaxID=196773 RepID=UPI0019F1A1A6|nr:MULTISPECIES: hypothetical protein [unclassified Devosia]MBF0679945.1 hypothetical protein [Devosia sp.]WEJ33104.1 hypothetical protein NYQ88_19970 [Devosia sp. SD17-2]
METASSVSDRRAVIAAAIAAELQRQSEGGATRIDVDALAAAVDGALVPGAPFAEGRRPEQLNATNDD